jgi:alpha-glucosidase
MPRIERPTIGKALEDPRMRRLLLACLLVTLSSLDALAGWASLGAMPAPRREGDSLLFSNEQGSLSVSVLSPEVVRVRFAPRPALGRDHSYAVVSRDLGPVQASFELTPQSSVIRTSGLLVTIRHAPWRISFARPSGEPIDSDDPERGISFAGSALRLSKALPKDAHVYGLGEKTGGLDKRGRSLGGAHVAMWNSDTYAYDMSTDPIYASVPFYMVLRQGRAHGVFLDNTFRTSFDVGRDDHDLLTIGAEGGELDYYLIEGPAPKAVIERYTALTGRMPLPPLWALGYHQCKYSYYPESKLRFIAENFRQRRIPADVLWLDIHYLDGYNPFTWDRERFPDPARMIRDLRSQGFRLVTIVDPHPKQQPGWPVYDSGLRGDHYVKNPDGSLYVAPVWPGQAERNPGPSVFPDFSKPAARAWWGEQYRGLVEDGVAGIWNDMNEPAVFADPEHTMPLDVRHDGEGQPTDHREIHNVYGLLMTKATHEGLLRLRPQERPFVLTRATFAGGQRYAAQWPGDNVSTWADLAQTLPMFMNMGISGLPFVGADIGGFAETPSAELFTRWLQLGAFYPFMRTHTTLGTPDQEPWSYGTRHEELNRRAIELRYELLPEVYDVMREASRTGLPAFRALFLEYPEDEKTWGTGDQFLFGRDLLVAPVLREAVQSRDVYLPQGDWYDLWTGERQVGGRTLAVPVSLASLPVFVRGGAFVFRQPVVQHTGEMPGQPLHVWVYPAARSEAVHEEDDGLSLAYQQGAVQRRRFAQTRTAEAVLVEAGASEGSFQPARRDLVFHVRLDAPPRSVRNGSTLLPRGEGWTWEPAGFAVVRLPDTVAALRLRFEP